MIDKIDKYFTTRRTVRSFSDRIVDPEMLRTMLEAASHAPTTGNMQLYSVIVTREPERKAALMPAHFSQPAAVNAPVILTFCADFNRFVKWCKVSDAEPGFDNLQSLLSAILDTTIFAQQFVTIAEQAGLGTCYLGTTTYNADKIGEVLALPKRVVPIVSLSVGWPAGDSEVSDRISAEAFIHDEVYKDYTDEAIRAAYAEKEARDDSRAFVAENGKTTLAQVFTDVRYPRSSNEQFSEVFREYIHHQGF